MKKILTLVMVSLLTGFHLVAQLKTPVKIQSNQQLRLKGTVPFFVKGSAAVRNIVPVNSSNPTFRMQRGTVGATRKATVTETADRPDENGKFCTTSVVSEEKGDFVKIVLGNQNDKIYPGAIYYDNAFIDGTYNAPGTLQLQPYDIATDLFSAASGGSSVVNVQPSVGM